MERGRRIDKNRPEIDRLPLMRAAPWHRRHIPCKRRAYSSPSYGTIGFAVDSSFRRFASNAAKDAGNRVRQELSSRAGAGAEDW
jgi:hypothetical protein